MKPAQPLLWLALLGYAALGHADDWSSFATTSNTTPGYLCDVTDDDRDLDCAAPNPQVLDGGVVSATGVSVSGVVTASAFVGDGSGLTGISGSSVNALDDIGDVDVPNPNNGQVLVWGGSSWVAQDLISVDVTTGATVYLDGPIYHGTGANLVDDNTNSGVIWNLASNNAVGSAMAFRVDLGSAEAVTGVRVHTPADGWVISNSKHIFGWKLQWSDDGSTGWTDVTGATVIDTTTANQWSATYSFSELSKRYWRLIPSVNGSWTDGPNLTEVELLSGGGGGADNLGNHTAEQALEMAGFDIQAAGLITATTVSSSNLSASVAHIGASAGIGTDSPNTTLHVSGTLQISDADGDGAGCSSATDIGKMRFNGTSGKFQLCRP